MAKVELSMTYGEEFYAVIDLRPLPS